MVESIWGGTTPHNPRKIREKKANAINMFLQVLSQSYWTTSRNSICSVGLSRDHHRRGGIQEIHEFRGFRSISQRLFDIFS